MSECKKFENEELIKLDKALCELEKARQEFYSDNTNDEDEAKQFVCCINYQLKAVMDSLQHTKATLEKAYNKLTKMFQALSKFLAWLEETQQKLKGTWLDDSKAYKKIVNVRKSILHVVSPHIE